MAQDLPTLRMHDAAAWQKWLDNHHQEPDGVWLVLAKKGTTHPTNLGYEEALRVALCYGWIDGQAHSADAATYLQRFTPRRARSQWSASNISRIEQLTAAGRMHPAGVAEVERAKTDGRWQRALDADAARARSASPQRSPSRDRTGVAGVKGRRPDH